MLHAQHGVPAGKEHRLNAGPVDELQGHRGNIGAWKLISFSDANLIRTP